ncbi:hypothetical protein IscW_ISCW022910 [Ixodes scapularis]|uniref:Uncharacterized protein n=1 Tax=Ixodes scapularis TaxID=6945 RepID=B7QBR3_IXOSC|nr:hypothetical protein IscW_ISCW022910 [Ixodes scapularis]|eukprot:XP_002412977.1 hypothetical protein IscW_ISCW022910 [Ixodes scapularis]
MASSMEGTAAGQVPIQWVRKTPKSNVVAFLEKRNTSERVLKERQLNHDKRRLALKEKRLALDQRKFDEEAQAGTQERHLEAEEKRLLMEVLLKQVKKY